MPASSSSTVMVISGCAEISLLVAESVGACEPKPPVDTEGSPPTAMSQPLISASNGPQATPTNGMNSSISTRARPAGLTSLRNQKVEPYIGLLSFQSAQT